MLSVSFGFALTPFVKKMNSKRMSDCNKSVFMIDFYAD